MSKKRRQVLTDETEYEFKETGEPQTDIDDELEAELLEDTTDRKPSILQNRLVKRIGIIVVLLIAVAIVYQFLTPSKVQTEAKQQEVQTQTTVVTKPAEVAPAIVAAQADVQREVDVLAQSSVAIEDQVKQLQTDMQSLNLRMDQLATALNDVTSKLQNYVDKVQALQEQSTTKKVSTVIHKKKVVKKASGPKAFYEVKAVVPGRAWVQSNAGRLTTVKVGDRLAGYGIIRSINADTGIVGTSSGRRIKYGPNDS